MSNSREKIQNRISEIDAELDDVEEGSDEEHLLIEEADRLQHELDHQNTRRRNGTL